MVAPFAFVSNFFAKRRFRKTIDDFEKLMKMMPQMIEALKVGMPLIRQQLKLYLGREQYKSELKKISSATDNSVKQMTEAIAFAKDFMQKNPSQFTEAERKMYEKKLDDAEKFKDKFVNDMEKLFNATPTPKAPIPKPKALTPKVAIKVKTPSPKGKCAGKKKANCKAPCSWTTGKGCK